MVIILRFLSVNQGEKDLIHNTLKCREYVKKEAKAGSWVEGSEKCRARKNAKCGKMQAKRRWGPINQCAEMGTLKLRVKFSKN